MTTEIIYAHMTFSSINQGTSFIQNLFEKKLIARATIIEAKNNEITYIIKTIIPYFKEFRSQAKIYGKLSITGFSLNKVLPYF